MRYDPLDQIATRMTVGNDCWEWTGHRDSRGYGRLGIKMAHRVVYAALEAPIPAGHVLDHLCRNHGCVRPSHLDPVTQQENVRRAPRMGPMPRA